jgi:DNA-binding NarL/FixJ family response regulator
MAGMNGLHANGALPKGSRIFIIDPHSIFRIGMIACLSALPDIRSVDGCDQPEQAWRSPALAGTDLILLDLAVDQVEMVIGRLHHHVGCPITAMTQSWEAAHVLKAVEAGAVGVLCKDGLSTESLGLQVRAALQGAGVIPPQLIATLLERRAGAGAHENGNGNGNGNGLTTREQRVLCLIADGKLTREVADELAYSERTVKSVLRDAVVKLGARSRSQAVAFAVREGLI